MFIDHIPMQSTEQMKQLELFTIRRSLGHTYMLIKSSTVVYNNTRAIMSTQHTV